MIQEEDIQTVEIITRINVETCNFIWNIENFLMCPCECLESPTLLPGGGDDDGLWRIHLYPKLKIGSYQPPKLAVGFQLEKWGPSECEKYQVSFKLSIIDFDNAICCTQSYENLVVFEAFRSEKVYFIDIDRIKEEQNTLLVNGNLKLQGILKVGKYICTKTLPRKEDNEIKLEDISKDFKTFYKSGRFSDFSLKVENIPVNRINIPVLAARSEVFAAMLEHDMLEKSSNCAVVKDLSSDVMKSLVVYLYSAQTEILSQKHAMSLYAAAVKYGIPVLIQRCRRYLISKLSVDNACEVLRFGDLHYDAELKNEASRFLCCNTRSFFETQIWVRLVKENPSLVLELLQSSKSHMHPKLTRMD